MTKIIRAFIYTHNPRAVVEFAKWLQSEDVEIISMGNTAILLKKASIKVTDILSFDGWNSGFDIRTSFPLPSLHNSLVADRGSEEALSKIPQFGVRQIDLIFVNLEPIEELIKRHGEIENVLKHVDVGILSLLQSAITNYFQVTTIVDWTDVGKILSEFASGATEGTTTKETRYRLAYKAINYLITYQADLAKHLFVSPPCPHNCQGCCCSP